MSTKRYRLILAYFLIALGATPGLVWLFLVGYMFYLGPRIGWISQRFLDIEATSLAWCVGMFLGIVPLLWGFFVKSDIRNPYA